MLVLATATLTKVTADRFDPVRRGFGNAQQAGSRKVFFDLDDLRFNHFTDEHKGDEHDKIVHASDAFAAKRNVVNGQIQPVTDLKWHKKGLLPSEGSDGRLHLFKMNIGIARVGNVRDFTIQSDEETDPVRHVQVIQPHAVKVHNFPVRIGDQGKVEFVFGNEFLVGVGGIETDAHDLDVVFLQFTHAVAKATSLLCAA